MTDKITLFSVPDCPHCAAARAWLRERGLAFSEVDVRVRGPVLHQALVHAGRPVVPVIEVGRQVLVGFDAERLAELIEGLERSGEALELSGDFARERSGDSGE